MRSSPSTKSQLLHPLVSCNLAHCCSIYSAHEHTSLFTPSASSSAASFEDHALPIDIVIELLVSVLLVSVGVVLASPQLRPIQWARWAGEIEKNLPKEEDGELRNVNPYAIFDERKGFWDVRVSLFLIEIVGFGVKTGTVDSRRSYRRRQEERH
jgi:membrane magnesium transporter 1